MMSCPKGSCHSCGSRSTSSTAGCRTLEVILEDILRLVPDRRQEYEVAVLYPLEVFFLDSEPVEQLPIVGQVLVEVGDGVLPSQHRHKRRNWS